MAKRTTRRTSAASRDGRNLVIVESPAKARTINKYLGSDYVVKASMGHVRDLPERDFGIDLSDDFKPVYQIVRARAKVIRDLKSLADKAPEVVLATDRDREGEAIAWHLVEALDLPDGKVKRVIFNEITKTAIREAFGHAHEIDMDRVNAQQARRILDRIVGYELSPLLWKKVARGLSAGRVQSVAVRIIVEREREIREFVPEESWKISAAIAGDAETATRLRPDWWTFLEQERTQKDIQRWLSEHGAFRVELAEFADEPFKSDNAEAARAVAEALGFVVEDVRREPWEEYQRLGLDQVTLLGRFDPSRAPQLTVADLATKRTRTRPAAPFTTATLQQTASSRLGFNTSRTMRVAQQLYEGIDLNGEGPVGLITYMRTDSTNLAREAVQTVRGFIGRTYGDKYVPDRPNVYGKRQERAQEAHEAIRPTDPTITPDSISKTLTNEQRRLYELIWQRFVACQMPPAEWDSTSVALTCETSDGVAKFTGSGRKLVFDGFMKVAGVTSEDQILPHMEVGGAVGLLDVEARQQFTSPPPRYTEASLVKALEAEGIGRPSTYAAIIDTIQSRGYVEQENRKFFPTALGELVTDKLVRHFPKIMDVKFTSYMEDELDKIEDAHLDWVHVLHEFYGPFREHLARAADEMQAAKSQPSEYECPQCGAPMVYRWSRTGRFLACSKYPDCKATLNVNRDGQPLVAEHQEHTCEECGRPMTVRQSRTGVFLGCTGYPDCRNTIPCDENGVPLRQVSEQEVRQACDACGEGTMVVKWKRGRSFLACDRYPKCKNTASLPEGVYVKKPPSAQPEQAGFNCDKCGKPMVIRSGRRGKFIACSGFPRCRNTIPIEKLEQRRAAAESGEADSSNGDEQAPADVAAGASPAVGARGDSRSGKALGKAKSARKSAASRNGRKGKTGADDLGEPPPGFAWTRTGRPVVEDMPEDHRLTCPQCGGTMELKRGRFGPFFACTSYPKCKFVANLRGDAKKEAERVMPPPPRPKPIPTDIPCPECGEPMVVRQGRSGRFLGCSQYPKCRGTQELPPGFKVPEPEAAEATR